MWIIFFFLFLQHFLLCSFLVYPFWSPSSLEPEPSNWSWYCSFLFSARCSFFSSSLFVTLDRIEREIRFFYYVLKCIQSWYTNLEKWTKNRSLHTTSIFFDENKICFKSAFKSNFKSFQFWDIFNWYSYFIIFSKFFFTFETSQQAQISDRECGWFVCTRILFSQRASCEHLPRFLHISFYEPPQVPLYVWTQTLPCCPLAFENCSVRPGSFSIQFELFDPLPHGPVSRLWDQFYAMTFAQ